MRTLPAMTVAATLAFASTALADGKPTVVLVHGAFAGSSWNGVITELEKNDYRTVAAANPLRSVAGDAAVVASLVASIDGPVVLVGHSYGGPVITEAANKAKNVKALVYVSAFSPDAGESSLSLSSMLPGSTLGEALMPVTLPDGGTISTFDRRISIRSSRPTFLHRWQS